MLRLARVPETGDSVVEEGIRFTVESMTGRRVNVVRVEKDQKAAEGSTSAP